MISGPIISAKDAASLVGSAVFLDARAGPNAAEAFAQAHIRGARYADLETDLSQVGDPAFGGRHPLPSIEVWRRRLGAWGITPTTPVVVYDDGGGGMAAARAWWMLEALGHTSLAVVDGGWKALREAGAPTESGVQHVDPIEAYPTAVDRWPTVDADFVERIRTDSSWRLVDARAPERYAGESEPIDPVAGHIPGARNLHWQSQLDAQGCFDATSVLRDRYTDALGDIPPERVVCYCGSGVTACHLLLAMAACGLAGGKLYMGSWSEWCRQERPRGTRQ